MTIIRLSMLPLFISSLLLGAFGAYLVYKFGYKIGLVDYPIGRSSHDTPTPKGGGIGILSAFVISSLALNIPLYFWLPTAFIASLSFFGDMANISQKTRLFFQFLAASLLLFIVLGSEQNLVSKSVGLVFMSVFIVGTANFYNFMDGINGIAAITGVAGFGLLGFYALMWSDNGAWAILAICISLSCLGFLPFNMPKAKIFMGDVGSIFLGFTFAAIVIMLSKNFLDFICLSSFLFTFYADELITMFFRLKGGENLLLAHRSHFYQLLANELAIPHWKISIGYGLTQLIVGLSVIAVRPLSIMTVLLLLTFYLSVFVLLTLNLRRKQGS